MAYIDFLASLSLIMLSYFYKPWRPAMFFFKFQSVNNSYLSLSGSFEYVCYASTTI